ncbi:MAG: hypothetical protein DI533_22445 [Cereibacter sphaeroides]|uniref:SHOCT domain-containing protein n=1 Tax=Cereibacter sphaeroides TaxID=1063 RepID=A0A2W5S2Q7_CERSP|nr:MAG: hypothetical protein DI533_22445 [Cereibacter sphaeroides]
MVDTEALKNLEKLNQLKNDGVISDAEFARSKERLLFGAAPTQTAAPSVADKPAPTDHVGWMLLALKRYAQFDGRSSRKEFWMFLLGVNLVNLVWVVIAAAGIDEYGDTSGLGKLALTLLVITIMGAVVPLIAAQVRRFHDQDKSGWFALLNLIPYIGFIIVLVFMLIEGTGGDNRFGPDPRSVVND